MVDKIIYATGASPDTFGQISGQAYLTVTDTPTIVELSNSSAETVYSLTEAQIVILELVL